jgi:hypothetical protein
MSTRYPVLMLMNARYKKVLRVSVTGAKDYHNSENLRYSKELK